MTYEATGDADEAGAAATDVGNKAISDATATPREGQP